MHGVADAVLDVGERGDVEQDGELVVLHDVADELIEAHDRPLAELRTSANAEQPISEADSRARGTLLARRRRGKSIRARTLW